jgi:hypothetical protein
MDLARWSTHMPPRYLSCIILAFWLATTSYFFYRDLWPRIHPEDKPPFSINLADEARTPPLLAAWIIHHNGERIGRATTLWEVFRNGQTAGEAFTLVRPCDEDGRAFEIYTNIRFRKFTHTIGPVDLHVRRMDSMYRVTAEGGLLALDTEVLIEVDDGRSLTVHVEGEVENGKLTPKWVANTPIGKFERTTEPVDVSSHHSMLNPMQPWNRLIDVQENQTWRIALFDPLADSVSDTVATMVPGVASQVQVRYLEAGVLAATEDRRWDNREVACLVIEYRDQDEKVSGKTYVRKSDGLVVRQEATRGADTMALERRPR